MENTFSSAPTIVVVDDDPLVRRAVIDTLEAYGLGCRAHASAEAYLKSNDADTTSCLILDVNFPTMSGLELQRQLTAAGYSFPIIFYSGDPRPAVEQEARANGAADFVSKAISPTQLFETITRALSASSG